MSPADLRVNSEQHKKSQEAIKHQEVIPFFSQCVKELGTEEIRVTLSYCSQCDGLDPLLLRLGYPIRFTFSYILYHAGANVAFGFEKGE